MGHYLSEMGDDRENILYRELNEEYLNSLSNLISEGRVATVLDILVNSSSFPTNVKREIIRKAQR